MSQIQEDAKPILIELFHGRWPEMTEQTRMAIASWATMVTMNLELADRATKATNQEDRYKFMSQRSPLDNWQVLVGLCQAQMEPGSFWHRAAAFLEGNTSEAIPSEPNTQTSTFFFGNCFIHTISGPKQFLPLPTDYAAQLGIRQIFPLGNSRTDKPMVFTGMGVSRVAVHFWVGHGLSPEPHMGLIDHLG